MKTLLTLALTITTLGTAAAQVPPQQQIPQRPVISPYLSLLNNNRPSYQNYYGGGGVLQQQQVYNNLNNINALQQQVQGLQNQPASTFPGTGSELSTGKIPGFFTHRGYFLNAGGVGIQRGTTGQYGTSGNNSVFGNQPGRTNQPTQSPNSIMPYNRR